MKDELRKLIQAAREVINSADNTGCAEDLTVVSASAVADLKFAYNATIDALPSLIHNSRN